MTAPSGESGLQLSIIIPGWNENRNIFNCIASLKKQTYKNFNVYMIVGGDDTTPVAKARNLNWKQLIVLDQVEPNKLKACNAALDHPELGNILIFSDMDCEFPEDFLDLYCKAFDDQKKCIITGRVCPDQQSMSFVDRYHRHYEEIIAPKAVKKIKSIVGANFAVRKDFFFHKYGRFDESIAIGTDHAIAKRFTEIGEPIYFDPRIKVYTPFFPAGLSKYMKQQSRWVRIRVLGNKKSNPKAFKSSIKALLIPWLIAAVIPFGLLFLKHKMTDKLNLMWYAIFFAWAALLMMAWLKRYAILRRGGKGNLWSDITGAFGMLLIQFGIQMIAGLQLISKKHKVRW